MKKRGFTLAEVLISLGIIGVVSAITMPALTANYQKKTYESLAKKAYNTLSVAIQTYMAQEGIDDLRDSDLVANRDKDEVWEKFANDYFKVAQICSIGASSRLEIYPLESSANQSKCFAETYKSLDRAHELSNFGNFENIFGSTYAKGINMSLTDGSSFVIFNCTTSPNSSQVFQVIFDTNGINGPNIMGRDYFLVEINSEGLVYDRIWKNSYANIPDKWYDDMNKKYNLLIPGIGKMMSDGWQMLY